MEDYSISDGDISAAVRAEGAELSSLKKGSSEYLWNADPAVWNRSAPQLFPIVGTLAGNEYRYDGKTYRMTRHGFARDTEFTLRSRTSSSIVFEMKDSAATRGSYPFPFVFSVGYSLKEGTLTYTWRILNTGKKTMYYSVGGHPAFVCPDGNSMFAGCSALFTGSRPVQELSCGMINTDGLLSGEKKVLPLKNGILALESETFSHDALILENSGIRNVTLISSAGKKFLSVGFDTDVFGLWSPQEKHAPFLCIEPWYGRCDRNGYAGNLGEREWGNSLEPGKTAEKSFTITVL
jgi:galactose mutarotase-like enzyme